jgi:hypothetical protein
VTIFSGSVKYLFQTIAPEEYGIPQLELSDSDSDSVSLYVPYFQKKVFFRGRFILIKDEEIQ